MKVPPLGTTWDLGGVRPQCSSSPIFSFLFLLYIILMVAISCDQWIHPPCNVYVSVLYMYVYIYMPLLICSNI